MINNSKLKIIFIISLIFITFVGCEDDDNWIPYVLVDETISLNRLTDMGHLQAKYWPGGVNGIIIFRLGNEEFYAYDRTCPYRPPENCAVEIEDESFAKCPCCESIFVISDGGYPNEGPAVRKGRPLKQYRTSVSNGRLRIYN